MASINLSGVLKDPEGNPDVGAIVKFTLLSTTGDTVKSSVSELIVPPDGSYNIDLVYGLVRVDYITNWKERFVAIITVNADTVATSIPELLNASTPPTKPQLLQFQNILADAVAAKDAAETAAATLDIVNDLTLPYVFDTVADMTASVIAFPVGKKLEVKRYYAGSELTDEMVFEVQAASVVDEISDHTLSNGNTAKLIGGSPVVVKVPTDFATIQDAVDTYKNYNSDVTVLVEAGHQLTKGLSCTRGDYGHIQIASTDAVVTLAPTFVGVDVEQNPTNGEVPRPPLCYGFHARMPRWNLTVNMENNHGSGLLLINCSTYVSSGKGVINAGFRGWQQRAGYGFASNTNFSGATGCAARVQKAGICNLGDANLTFACKTEDLGIGALYVSRSCTVEARGADVSDSGAGGIVCRRSIVTAVDCHASRCVQAAFECQSGGVIDAVNSVCDTPQNEAYYVRFGGTLIASGATVTSPNIPSRIFVCDDGGHMVVNGGTTVDAVSINETHLNAQVPEFNVTYGDGMVSHPDKQAIVESGSNANGTWQKFADGRMVVESGIRNIDITVASGAYSTQIQKPALPQSFVSVYDIKEKVVGKTGAGGGGSDIFVHSCSNMSATSNEWKVFNTGQQIDGAATGASIASVQIQMQVTGSWK